jgi:hypothetical protein
MEQKPPGALTGLPVPLDLETLDREIEYHENGLKRLKSKPGRKCVLTKTQISFFTARRDELKAARLLLLMNEDAVN